MKTTRTPLLWAALGLVMAASGCAKLKSKYGEGIPSHIQTVKLREILSAPPAYDGKEVVLAGNYGNYCCAKDFSYREGMDAVEVSPTGFDSPKAERGKPVRIYGTVRVRHPHGEAEGEKEEDEEEKTEEGADAGFKIEARGVEFP